MSNERHIKMRRALNHLFCALAWTIRGVLILGVIAIGTAAAVAIIAMNVILAWRDPAEYFSVIGIILVGGGALIILIVWAIDHTCDI